MFRIILTLLPIITMLNCDLIPYNGFKVFRIVPQNDDELFTLRSLENAFPLLNFWKSPSTVNKSVELMVPPHLKYDFQNFVDSQKWKAKVFIEDVQKAINNEKPANQSSDFGWTGYYRLNQIYEWMDEISQRFSGIVKVIIGGKSYLDRDIKGLYISFSKENENNAVFLEGGIHAREWISPATVTYIANEILTSQNTSVRNMVEKYDWYIFPVFNPDGYEYTHTRNRMWRKTRVPYGLCTGADPNRNWNYKWNTGGSSNFACLETYAGPRALSEPCVKTMSEFISGINEKLIGYIAFHSYSQLLLYPYGHTKENLDNAGDLQIVGEKTAKSLSQRYGTEYKVGNVASTIYVATGSSVDWVKGNFKTKITYTYELRDTGEHGFLLPADQIIPTGEETMDSLVTMMNEFENLGA